MRRNTILALTSLCALALVVAVTTAQDKKPADEPKKPEPARKAEEPKKAEPPKADAKKPEDQKGAPGGMDEEMMKKMMEYATPGEAHKKLDPLVGKWDYEIQWSMAAGAPEMVTKGTSEVRWIYDHRYLQQEVSGPPEEPNGPPMKGMSYFGYDNGRKQYFNTWMDNMGTGFMMGFGTADATGKKFAFSGEDFNLLTGKMEKWRSNLTLDTDKMTFEYFGAGADGKEFKMMTITYTRAK
jgi:hypothetical protein